MPQGPFWHPDEDANLHLPWEEFSVLHPERSKHAWRQRRKRLGLPNESAMRWMTRETLVTRPSGDALTLTPQVPDENWEVYFDTLYDADELSGGHSTTQEFTDWHAPDDGLPVGLVFSGDWHRGARGVLNRRLDADLDILRETPGLYGIGMGDYMESVALPSKTAPALFSGLFNSGDEQERNVRMAMQRGMSKWIVLLPGNHDERAYKHLGISRVKKMAEDLGVPHFSEGGGTVYAHVGSNRYAIGVRHNTAGNSRINTTNPQRRMFDDWPEWENLHVACIAHRHFNDLQYASRKGGRCVYLRSGTYKVHDHYAKANGFTPEYGVPLAILYPDVEKVIAFRGDDIEDGLRFLAAERLRYRNGHTTD